MHPFPIIGLLCCLLALQSPAQQVADNNVRTLSPDARVSIITCGPGPSLYALFGHTALRIQDTRQGIDLVYNYGTFHFEPPAFYTRFLLGTQLYYASVTSFRQFQPEYTASRRYLFEQVIALSPAQQQRLYRTLTSAVQPANRYYHYAFFTNNCSTRPLDLLLKISGASIPKGDSTQYPTPVQLMHPYLANTPWVSAGFDFLLGRFAHAPIPPKEQAFLPEQLAAQLELLRVNGKPLVKERRLLYKPTTTVDTPAYIIQPFHVALLLFLAAAFYSIADIKWRYNNPAPDAFFFCLSGAAGILLAVISLASAHAPLHHNLHVLWLLPTHLVAGILMQFRRLRTSNWFRLYLGLSLCLQLVFLMTAPFLGIVFQTFIYLLCGSITIRCFSLLKVLRED